MPKHITSSRRARDLYAITLETQNHGKMLLLLCMAFLVIASLTGCATTQEPPPPVVYEEPVPEPQSQQYEIADYRQIPRAIVPSPITIPFYYQKRTIHREAARMIDRYLDGLETPELLHFTIEGYTCNQGYRAYNVQLSLWRAQVVRDYMIAKGISPSAITTIGHGQDDPIASNRHRSGRVKNRRVTITASEAQ